MSGLALSERLRVVLVTPGDRPPARTRRLVERALDGGVTAVIVREPELDAEVRARLCADVVAAGRAHGALVLIAREPRLAAESGADGVHLGGGGPPVDRARAAVGGSLVGRSCHWPPEAEDDAADYVLLSPFGATHRSRPRPRLEEVQVRAVLERLAPAPVVALGGLTSASVPALPDGLAGVAVIRAIADASDPREAAARLRAAVERRFGAGSR